MSACEGCGGGGKGREGGGGRERGSVDKGGCQVPLPTYLENFAQCVSATPLQRKL